MWIINEMRRMMLARMELIWDEQCVVDSLPIPVVQFHLAPQSRGDWPAYGANYGHVSSKKMTIFGFKLHMLITIGGLILDFELAPASVGDLAIGRELLEEHYNRIVIGDKAYVSAPVADELWQNNRIRLLTKPRSNQRKTDLSICPSPLQLGPPNHRNGHQSTERTVLDRNQPRSHFQRSMCSPLHQVDCTYPLHLYQPPLGRT